ncbi:type 2 isopentenyl-diphosphate Delta-isomerase, partial [Alkalicoccobacillus plakortidis]
VVEGRRREINKKLASMCNKYSIAMAVGSQKASLKDRSERKTFEVVRKYNEDGLLFANIGAECSLEYAKEAVKMISADALQLHLNHIQELVMPEGDRNFVNRLHNISKIVEKIGVPVIVKEVGFGISMETVETLESIGVQYIDISGRGGTNFSKIENERNNHSYLELFNEWGISTPSSLIEALSVAKQSSIISSGGLTNGLDIVKSLALGAKICGLSYPVLKALNENGVEGLDTFIQSLQKQITFIMTALGTPTIDDLNNTDIVITGETNHWLSKREIDTSIYSVRSKGKRSFPTYHV